MSITITATPAPDRHAIDLVILASEAATLVSLRRTDANGADDVRLPEMPDTFEAIALADYEAALTGIVQYEVIASVGGDEETADVTAEFSRLDPFTWIMHPAVMPEDTARVTFVNWNMTRATRSARHTVIGRPDPIVNRDVLGLRTGTLDVFAMSYDDVQRITAACERQETMMIRQNDFPGLDGYFEVDEVTPTIKLDTARPDAVRWLVRLTLTEVTIPTGPLLAPTAWTYGTVADEFGSYRAVRNTYRTYRDLLLDERVA